MGRLSGAAARIDGVSLGRPRAHRLLRPSEAFAHTAATEGSGSSSRRNLCSRRCSGERSVDDPPPPLSTRRHFPRRAGARPSAVHRGCSQDRHTGHSALSHPRILGRASSYQSRGPSASGAVKGGQDSDKIRLSARTKMDDVKTILRRLLEMHVEQAKSSATLPGHGLLRHEQGEGARL